MRFPAPVSEYLASEANDAAWPSYLLLNQRQELVEGGGHLSHYGLEGLQHSQPVMQQLACLHGLLPAGREPLFLPLVQLQPDCYVDIHLFATHHGDWVVLADRSADARKQRERQQTRYDNTFGAEAEAVTFRRLIEQLQLVVLEQLNGERFRVRGERPGWLHALNLDAGPELHLGQHPVLGDFLQPAQACWESGPAARLRSAIWAENDPTGGELYLQACALTADDRKLLLLESMTPERADRSASLQSAREQKLALEAAESTVLGLQATFDGVATRIAILSQSGHILVTNTAWRGAYASPAKIPYSEVGTDYQAALEQVADQASAAPVAEIAAGLRQLLGRERDRFSLEFAETSDPDSRWWFMQGTTFVVDGAKHMVVSFDDISDRRHAQEQARQQQAELAHVYRLNTVNEMTTAIAHELNQPLTAIASFCDAACDLVRAGNVDLDRLDAVIEQTARQARRASGIIRSLRGFVQRSPSSKVLTQLNDVVGVAAELVDPEARLAEVQISLELSADLPPVRLDLIQIEQVLVNLLRNGIEAMQQLDSVSRQIIVATSIDGDDLRVTVRDTGPGLTAAAHARLFDPFQSDKIGGLGMGLAISRTLVEAHGGHLWAEPRATAGAVFHFALPATE